MDILLTSLPSDRGSSQPDRTTLADTTTEDIQTTVVIPDDPCEPGGSLLIQDDRRYYAHKGEEGSYICDDDLASRWYAFKYQDQWAEITTTCIKSGQCGTDAPYRIQLEDDETMPGIGEELNTTMCEFTYVHRLGNMLPACCLFKQPVRIRNCTDHLVYYITPKPKKNCDTGLCLQLPGEIIPYEYLGDPPPTPAPTTEEPTTKSPLDLPIVALSEMSASQQAGIITVVYTYPRNEVQEDFEKYFDAIFRRMLVDALNNLPPPPTEEATTVEQTTTAEVTTQTTTTLAPGEVITKDISDIEGVAKPKEDEDVGPDVPDLDNEDAGKGPGRRRRAHAQGGKYNESDVYYVAGTPRAKDGTVEMAVFVRKGDDDAVSQARLMEAMESINGTSDSEVGNQTLITFYEGLPQDLDPEHAGSHAGRSVWDLHRDLFIAIIVLAIICLLIILIGICCIKYKDRKDKSGEKTPMTMEEGKKGKKVPLTQENPVPDEEITRDEAPMVERENPAVTPNGSGQHISKKDEDNGWVVPLDQLSSAEKDKPETENTKL